MRPNPADASLYDGGVAVPDLGAWEHELPASPYPTAVEDVTATPLHKSVLLQWDYHQDGDINRYIAYFSEDSISFTAADTVPGRFTTRSTITGLNNGQEYWFYVTALDTADYESSASLQKKTSPYFHGPKWYVDTDNGTSSGEGSPENPAKYIRDMIDDAATGDTILVMPGTYDHAKNRNLNFQYNNDVFSSGVKNLVLMSAYGPDTTIIDLDGNDFIMFENGEDNSSKVVGLTIQNSNSGAVNLTNSNPGIENCIFLNNENDQNGGAINIEGWTGGERTINISNNLFVGNSIQAGTGNRGGAIMLGGDGNNAYVENCIFYMNSADETGGAINQDNNTNLVIVNSSFINNFTTSNWGGTGGVNSFAMMYDGTTTIICLLYTSPSPRDATLSRMPSSA